VIAVCGEALIDLVDRGDGLFAAYPGGSPTNVAVGLARLAVPTTLVARVSDDTFGRLLTGHLLDNQVDTRFVVPATEPTTLAVASLDPAGVASYRFYVNGTADWQWTSEQLPADLPADVDAIHVGSLALAVEPAATVLTAMLHAQHQRGQVTISLDPNLRAPEWAPERRRGRAAGCGRQATRSPGRRTPPPTPGMTPSTYPDVTALVTGGVSGIGAATAARLPAAGVRVVTADLSLDGDETLDITDPDAVHALRDAIGPVGILVNSAGVVGPSRPLVDIDLDAWRATLRVNVDGTFLMCRAFVPGLVAAGWGRVVNLASIAGKDGNPHQSAYSASKAAVIGLTKSLGKELAPPACW